MDSALPTQVPDNSPSFPKPLDATNRKYRRHTPIHDSDSSSSGVIGLLTDSPKRRGHGPVYAEDKQRKDDRRESENDSNHNRSSRGTDSSKYSDKKFHGTSHDYAKNGDRSRHHRHADEEDRDHHRSSRSVRESRIGTDSDYTRHNNNSDRSREIWRSGEKYSRDKSESVALRSKDKDYKYRDRDSDKPTEFRDERRDHHRSPDNYRNDCRSSREEPRAHGKDSTLRRESGSSRSKDTLLVGEKEINVLKDKREHDDRESNRRKEKISSKGEEGVSTKVSQEQSALKKLKHYDSEDEDPSSSSKNLKETSEKFTSGSVIAAVNQSETTQDLNAAKVAAMKAAELVNKNLVGSSYLSTDQKKKLLWGNKKNTSTEEQPASNCWDLQLFADRERQEKFNKLMGVKGDAILERKPSEMDAEMKQKLEMDLEKQYTAGLRRRDGRTVGLGL